MILYFKRACLWDYKLRLTLLCFLLTALGCNTPKPSLQQDDPQSLTQRLWNNHKIVSNKHRWMKYPHKDCYFSFHFVRYSPGQLKICYEPGCGVARIDILKDDGQDVTFRVTMMTTIPLNLVTGQIIERSEAIGKVYRARIKGWKIISISESEPSSAYRAKGTTEFLRNNFGLQMTNFVFGSGLTNFIGARDPSTNIYPQMHRFSTETNFADGLTWYRTQITDIDEKYYPTRSLRLGFQDDHLKAIHLWIGPASVTNQEQQTRRLDRIYREAKAAGAKVTKGGEWEWADKDSRIRTISLCSPKEPHFSALLITPPR